MPEFLAYHDREWGFPVVDDIRLFEKLCLESFQSGLSWRTILAKRENFRATFAGFDFRKGTEFDEADEARLGEALPGTAQAGVEIRGATTVYAFMQAMGLINDHAEGCVMRSEVDQARKTLQRPF